MNNLFSIGLVFASSSLLGSARAVTETREFDLKNLTQVVVENSVGSTEVSVTPGTKAVVEYDKKEFPDACRLAIDRSGHKLVVNVGHSISGMLSHIRCDVNLVVRVPQRVGVKSTSESGSINVVGTNGELELASKSGDLIADGTFSKIAVRSASGNVNIKGVAGSGDVKTESGAVTLSMSSAALAGKLSVKTESGAGMIYLPKGTPVKTNFESKIGTFSNELGNQESAAYKILLKTKSGDFKIKSY